MADMQDIAQILQSLLSSDNNENNTDNKNQAPDPGNEESSDNSGGFDFSGLSGLFGGDSSGNSDGSNDFFGGIDIDMILKFGSIFAELQKNDKNTALLIALKPMLRDENQLKIDTAIKLVKIMGILPLLRENGLFDKLF